jgi:hypothetical protein
VQPLTQLRNAHCINTVDARSVQRHGSRRVRVVWLSAVPQGKQHAQPVSQDCSLAFSIINARRKHSQRSR